SSHPQSSALCCNLGIAKPETTLFSLFSDFSRRISSRDRSTSFRFLIAVMADRARAPAPAPSLARSFSLWLSTNPSKRWGELFFLSYTPFWLTLCLGIIVPFKLYESFTEMEYMVLGLVAAVPSFLIPVVWPGEVNFMGQEDFLQSKDWCFSKIHM
ncbi:Cycloeucalenol cycloisomerase, partial [Cucurbita argyrosperma subsp. argyrosperma]